MMNKIVNDYTKETVFHHTLKNNLNVYIIPKKDYKKTYVALTTPFGSNINHYKVEDKEYIIPAGVAHFLEHKLFERNGKDISEEFSKNSARVNAFTTNTHTTYLFSATKEIKENTKRLLDFVLSPSFTKEGIDKEVGIITQEINMYEDDPLSKAYMGLLKLMYPNHPVSIDILGTEETIKEINLNVLTNTHKSFYHPSQMILSITGNVDETEMVSFLDELYDEVSEALEIDVITKFDQEHSIKEELLEFDVLQDNAIIGIKCPNYDYKKTNYIKQELTYAILLDLLFGKGSENYQYLLDKEVINDTFSYDVTLEYDYSHIMIASNTLNHTLFYNEIDTVISKFLKQDIDKNRFDRTIKQITGGFIHALNSVEYIANQYTKYLLKDLSLFDMLEVARTITIEDVTKLKEVLKNKEQYFYYTLVPNQK